MKFSATIRIECSSSLTNWSFRSTEASETLSYTAVCSFQRRMKKTTRKNSMKTCCNICMYRTQIWAKRQESQPKQHILNTATSSESTPNARTAFFKGKAIFLIISLDRSPMMVVSGISGLFFLLFPFVRYSLIHGYCWTHVLLLPSFPQLDGNKNYICLLFVVYRFDATHSRSQHKAVNLLTFGDHVVSYVLLVLLLYFCHCQLKNA